MSKFKKKPQTFSGDDVLVFAMRRSGHHAIIDWMIALLGSNTTHYNDVCLLNDGLFLPRKDLWYKNIRRVGDGAKHVINFEEVDLMGKFPEASKKVLVLRDAYNTFASRIKYRKKNLNYSSRNKKMVEIWLQHAAEFVGETSFLGKDTIKINYNKWFSDVSYRKELADQYFGGFLADRVDKVSHIGSSFDGFNFQGHAQDMKVLERYKLMLGNRELRDLSEQEKIKQYCKDIFDMNPPVWFM
jgi:hypothetical protein